MKTAFIITSAINFKGSTLIETIERLQQVIHTIDSINSRVKDADIFLIDSGQTVLSQDILDLIPKDVTVLSVSQNPKIEKIQKDAESFSEKASPKYSKPGKSHEDIKNFLRIGYIKSITEHFMLNTVFDMYDFSNYDLVFKISGRYFLNDKFSLQNYSNSSISVKLLKNQDSVCTMIWSFPGSKFMKIKNGWGSLLVQMDSRFKRQINTDIEEGIFLTYINGKSSSDYLNVPILGISGIVNNPFGKTLQSL